MEETEKCREVWIHSNAKLNILELTVDVFISIDRKIMI